MPGAVAPRAVPGDAEIEARLGDFSLAVGTGFGPRVLGLRKGDSPDLFARLGANVVIDRADSGVYRMRGGHRLWVAPEVPWTSYAPDDDPCEVTVSDASVTVTGPVDRAGVIKQIVIGLETGRLLVDHTLINGGSDVIEAAPWAITQLRLGGVAIVPLSGTDGEALQADRSLVLWPYTSLADARLAWQEGSVTVRAQPGPRLKIGSGPAPGRIGYLSDGWLFTKEVPAGGDGRYPDRGAVAQCFVDDTFCELESVGGVTRLDPGGRVAHREVWRLEECEGIETAIGLVVGTPG